MHVSERSRVVVRPSRIKSVSVMDAIAETSRLERAGIAVLLDVEILAALPFTSTGGGISSTTDELAEMFEEGVSLSLSTSVVEINLAVENSRDDSEIKNGYNLKFSSQIYYQTLLSAPPHH